MLILYSIVLLYIGPLSKYESENRRVDKGRIYQQVLIIILIIIAYSKQLSPAKW